MPLDAVLHDLTEAQVIDSPKAKEIVLWKSKVSSLRDC
jgi:hypothetical protein